MYLKSYNNEVGWVVFFFWLSVLLHFLDSSVRRVWVPPKTTARPSLPPPGFPPLTPLAL